MADYSTVTSFQGVLRAWPVCVVAALVGLSLSCSSAETSVETLPPDSSVDKAESSIAQDAAAEDSSIVPESSAEADSAPEPHDSATEESSPESGLDVVAETDVSDVLQDEPVGNGTCGDGLRDPLKEECDDGLSGQDQACADGCTVTDRLVVNAPKAMERHLSGSAHPTACGSTGQVVSFLEELFVDAGGDYRLGIGTFSGVGTRLGVAWVPHAYLESDAAVAALPDGSFAVAYGGLDGDGGGLEVILARVPADGSSITTIGRANETSFEGQHSPDALWNGQELVLAWLDDSPSYSSSGWGRRICTRKYDASLTPKSGEQCTAELENLPSNLALAPSDVLSWMEATGGTARSVVQASAWAAPFVLDSAEPPSLGWIDSQHLLVAYSNVVVVLDGAGTTVYGPEPLVPVQAEPRLAVTEAGIYLAWQDENQDEVWLQKLSWNGSALDLSAPSIPLPHDAVHRAGQQARPALIACPGGMLAAWEDITSSNYPLESQHGDVAIELIPTPVLRGTP